jgi:hypothetical protein
MSVIVFVESINIFTRVFCRRRAVLFFVFEFKGFKKIWHGNLAKPGLICAADFRAANWKAAVSDFLYA